MLTELRIEDFAIIHHLELTFGAGLLTFTGETGAGKSIILDAISLLLGGRADNDQIRSGAETAAVEGFFSLPASSRHEIMEILTRESLVDEADLEHMVLSRELRLNGRSVARINGHSVSIGLLRELGSYLIDIHGQSEHLSLLNERNHLDLLDRYAGSEALLESYRDVYTKLQAVRRELKNLQKDEYETARQIDFLTFQINEIETAHLVEGEEEELRQERDRLANSEKLSALAQESIALLERGSPEYPALTDLLGEAIRSLTQLSRIDPSQSRLLTQAESLTEVANDIIADLQSYQEQIEFNPRRLVQVEERMELIHSLQRKYGKDIPAVLSFARSAQQKLDNITHAGERIEELEEEEKKLLKMLALEGKRLSERRFQAAQTMSQAVERELTDLNMENAHFKVEQHFLPDPDGVALDDGKHVAFDSSGLDKVAFLIDPNPGEGFKPLAKIASGGETSRLMLALKNVLAKADHIPTLIFDEIDQGIGGRVGAVVGEKLWQLGQQHQVLCVTHLAQLAAFGAQHFKVYKYTRDERTYTEVSLLDNNTRVDELTMMFGAMSDANRDAARETLDTARKRVAEITRSSPPAV
jgi:DNA repair protein RecN (Recombination protein N)